jgi:thiol-disulfide isomerase/thioredoxin
MQSRRWLFLIVVAVLVMAVLAVQHRHGVAARLHRFVFGNNPAPRAHILVGEAMPKFELSNIAGDRSTIAARPGRVLYLNVFTTWCPDCVLETPTLEKLSRLLAGKPVDIIGIDQQESAYKVRDFAARYGLRYPIFMDDQGISQALLGVHFIPTTFVVDGNGIVRANISGPLTLSQMQQLVQVGLHHGM